MAVEGDVTGVAGEVGGGGGGVVVGEGEADPLVGENRGEVGMVAR